MQINDERWLKRILEWTPKEIRKRGRPRKKVERVNLYCYEKKKPTGRLLLTLRL